jgi:hypothetical protein
MANPPKSSSPLRVAKCFWWCGPALIPLEDVFSVRICPMGPRDLMMSQMFLIHVGIDLFLIETGDQRPISLRSAAHSARMAYFRPFDVAYAPRCNIGFFHLENVVPVDAEACAYLCMVLSCTEL